MTTKSQKTAVRRQTLLEELQVIDVMLLNGTATSAQEGRGRKIVNLANAARELLDALKHLLCTTELNLDELEDHTVKAIESAREAIANATGAQP